MSESGNNSSDAVVFDQETFFRNFEGMEDLARESVSRFLSLSPKLVSEIDSAISAGDSKKLELAAHTIKGAIANFYAEPARRAAYELEVIGAENRLNDATEALSRFKVELHELKKALLKVVNSKDAA